MMEHCPVSGAKIVSSPHWIFRNPAKHYATRIKKIGKNILFAWIDANEPVTLEVFERGLVKKVLEDAKLEDKSVYFIWNLDNVKGISYAYKHGIADFLYNPSPLLNCVVFYNTIPEFLDTVESIQAILPSSMTFFFAENYQQAMGIILDMIAGKNQSPGPDESDECEELKKRFLATTARIGWMNMLSQPEFLPDPGHDFFTFFSALSFLQQDLAEEEACHKEKIDALEKTQKETTSVIEWKISSIKDEMDKLLVQFGNERTLLEEKLSLRRNECRSASAQLSSQSSRLGKIIQDTVHLPISTRQKKQVLDTCEKFLEAERNRKKTDLPLTSTDSAFLSLLHQKHPNLNNRELTICLFIRLNYDNTKIADYYSITKRGMESARYRLHKKIGLQKNRSLKNYLTSFADSLGSSP